MSTGIFQSTGAIDLSKTPSLVGKYSFASMITRLMPNGQAPLFGLTSMLKEETAVQIEHGYFAKVMLFPSAILNGALAAGATTLVVDATDNILPGMILQNPTTRENILVTAVASATQLTVRRGVGVVAAGALADDVVLYQVGNASEEGSKAPQALRLDPIRITNLTQIFRNAWSLTGTVQATAVIAGDSHVAENKQDCAAFHAADIEKAIFFGQKYNGTLNGQPLRAMDGLISIITQHAAGNIHAAGSTTNATQLEAMLDPVFDQTTDPKHANERILFVGSKAMVILNQIARKNGTYQLMDGQTSWGLQFQTFKTTRGTFRVIEHPLFNSNPIWSAMAVVIDLVTFNLAYLAGRKTLSKAYNAQGTEAVNDAIDATGGTLTTELTTVCKNPAAYAVITGFTASAVG